MKRLFLFAAILISVSGSSSQPLLPATGQSALVVEFKRPMTQAELTAWRAAHPNISIERFSPYSSKYFDRLYEMTAATEKAKFDLKRNLERDSRILRIEEPKPVFAASITRSLTPASRNTLPENDPFENYQWALSSADQKVQRPINDLDATGVGPSPNHLADIGLSKTQDIDSDMKRQVLVAVIDSGVDYNHEDLQGSIYKNTPECDNGVPPLTPQKDVDGNGYAGDCMGWDFTAAPGANGANKPLDNLGHGTHVSGIIAAMKNNKIGVSGISNRIKIVPLKVMNAITGDADSITTFMRMGLTDKVAKAILYAVKMKVDVINLSMGWPRMFDSQFLQQAFDEARKAGVTIVAAAGNNNTYSTVLPCSYEGVICVAATGIDNTLTDFSNYGGQVEIAAPGEQILSTFPKSLNTFDFDFKGYEILDGTSQAAPFVTAAVGVLKGRFPGISEDEVKARLFAGSQPLISNDSRHIEFGTLKIDQAIAAQPQPVIVPDFKSLDRIVYSSQDNTIRVNLPVKNLWRAQDSVTVRMESLAPQLTIVSGGSLTADFAASQTYTMQAVARLNDPSASSNIRLQITVSIPGQKDKQFLQDVIVSRSVTNDPTVQTVPIQLSSQTTTLNTVMRTVPDFSTVLHAPEYYWIDSGADANRAKGAATTTLHLLQLKGSRYEETVRSFTGIQNLISVIRIPTAANSWEYLLEFIATTTPSVTVRFDYYSQDLQPRNLSFTYTVDKADGDILTAVLSPSFLITKASLISLSSVDSLTFIANGKITPDDKDPNPFDFEDETAQGKRIYFFQPVGKVLKLRLFDNYLYLKNLRQQLGMAFKDDLVLVNLLPQPFGSRGIRALYAYGSDDNRKLAIVSATSAQLLQHTFTLQKLNVSSAMLATGSMATVTDISGHESVDNAGVVFAEKITDSTGMVQYLTGDNRNPVASIPVKSTSPLDIIVDYRQGFRNGNSMFSFIETKDNMLLEVNDLSSGAVKSFAAPIHRTSVSEVTPVILSESFVGTTFRNRGVLYPAMFVDASQLFSSHFYITYGDPDRGLISPAEMDLDIPTNCSILNPAKYGNLGDYAFVMLCHNQNAWEVRFLPMARN